MSELNQFPGEWADFGATEPTDFYRQSVENAAGERTLADTVNRSSRQGPLGNVIDASRLLTPNAVMKEGMPLDLMRRVPTAVMDGGKYGDMVQLTVPIASGADVVAVQRPKNTRVLLIIINNQVANLYVAFDQTASAFSLPIPPGGALFFDAAVPQNDVHLFYGVGAVLVPIFYINVDITTGGL